MRQVRRGCRLVCARAAHIAVKLKHWRASIGTQALKRKHSRPSASPRRLRRISHIRAFEKSHSSICCTRSMRKQGAAHLGGRPPCSNSHTPWRAALLAHSHTSKLAHSHTHTPYTALSRYGVAELWKRTAVGKAHGYAATLTVNVVGSFILGCVAGGVQPGSDGVLLLGTGFCGAFTTFSTYAVDTVKLVEVGKYVPAVLYAVSSNFLCLGAALAGMRFTSSPPVAAAIGRFMSTHPPVGSLFAATSVRAGVPST